MLARSKTTAVLVKEKRLRTPDLHKIVRFEILMAVKVTMLCDVTQYGLVGEYQHFGETYHPHLQDRGCYVTNFSHWLKFRGRYTGME
jgi:hypothetical protein